MPVLTMATDNFYGDLPTFSEFVGIAENKNFCQVPSDWMVVITDVAGSTEAISAGKYKDVNTIGAAAITAVQNVLGEQSYPYVFGGDGATLMVSKADMERIRPALLGLRHLAQRKFGLKLRIGAVAVSELRNEGYEVEVAKMRLPNSPCIAVFKGGGVAAAEQKIKTSPEIYELRDEATPDMELTGLSCRWQATPSKNGRILSMLIKARTPKRHPERSEGSFAMLKMTEYDAATYKQVLEFLENLIGGAWDKVNPVHLEKMRYKSFLQMLRDERRYHDSLLSQAFLFRLISMVISILTFKYKYRPKFFDSVAYKNSLPSHSDYRKFDDALRMVIDCTADQVENLKTFLNELYQNGDIYYGLHESDTSLMTCYTRALSDDQHIHFIDGGDGGYAMAARQLKQQMAT